MPSAPLSWNKRICSATFDDFALRQLLRLLILLSQPLHKIFAPVVKALQFAGRPRGNGVGRDQRHCNRRVTVADDRPRQLIRIHLPPAHRFAGCCAGQATGVGAGIGNLQKVVMPLFGNAQNLLKLRFGLEDEILGRTSSTNEHARSFRRRASPPTQWLRSH